ncbi:hypothetical protein GSI_12157 [Ganoderma sinense ZZ0214-1]|uniref:Transporter n=1 Tax=Ganoderma sinense ZZ0214-1 TaxID=1077348 RepID=A0A2G8RY10_9APHY|nr:hypothetical protein GSI_12157 [Ganoderma sinense ZZ0214-1]
MSTAFLLRLHTGVKFRGKQPAPKGPRAPLSAGSYAARIRTLFWIALSNFVFPVVFDIAQLVLIFRDASYIGGGYVISVNSYISILGVLFSTIWSGSHRVAEATLTSSSPQPSVCSQCRGITGNPYHSAASLIARCLPRPPTPLPLRADLGRSGSGSDSPQLKGRFAPTSSRMDADALSAEGSPTHSHELFSQTEPASRFSVAIPAAIGVRTQHR